MERNSIEAELEKAKNDRGIGYFQLAYSSVIPIVAIASISYLSSKFFGDIWKSYAAAFFAGVALGNTQIFEDCYDQIGYSLEEIRESSKTINRRRKQLQKY